MNGGLNLFRTRLASQGKDDDGVLYGFRLKYNNYDDSVS